MFNWRKKKAAKSRILGLDLHENGCALAVLDLKDPSNPAVVAAHWCEFDGAREQQFRQALRAVGGEGLPVVANLNHNAYSLVQLEAPDLPDEEMREAMRWKVKDLIDYPVADAVLDVFRLPKSRRPGAPDLIYVVVARNDEIQQLGQLLTGAGLEIVAIDIVEMAMRNLAFYLDQPQRPRAYLHLRPRDTVIEIADGPDIYLSRRIIQDLDLDADPDLLSAQMENLALEVQRSLDYFESQYALGPADQLSVIVSREALFNAFSGIANTFLTVASVRFDFSALAFADGVEAEDLDLGMTAIGAAMRRAA